MPEHPICAVHKKLSDVYLYIFKQARQRAEDYTSEARQLQKISKQQAKFSSIFETAKSVQNAKKAKDLLSEVSGLRARSNLYRDNIVTYFKSWIDCGLTVAKKKTPRPLTYFERLMIVVWYPQVTAAKLAKKAASKKK